MATSPQLADLSSALAARLLSCRNSDGGWGYAPDKRSRVEPTCWALLALRAGRNGAAVGDGALLGWARSNGFLVDVAGAPPNLAFNGLAALTLLDSPTSSPGAGPILDSLAAVSGETLPPDSVMGQDNSLRGWPWLPSTFSWVEPTALCTLALKKAASGGQRSPRRERVQEASRLLADRASLSGGWNYGNRMVFGKALAPQVPTTALALLALQDHPDDRVVRKGLGWLSEHATAEPSLLALGLAAIALDVLGHPADEPLRQLEAILTTRPAEAHGLLGLGLALYALSAASERYRAFHLNTVAS